MHTSLTIDAVGGTSHVSTGHLPPPELREGLVSEAHARYKSNTDGENSQVYPALARVPSDLFGVCVVGTSGNVYAVGDTDHEFSIMSVSKPFVFALVCQCDGRGAGPREARRQRHRPAVQLAGGHRAQRGRPDQPDGECRCDRDDQPRAGRRPSTPSGSSFTTACPGSPAASSRSTRRCTLRRRKPTSATRASPGCCRASAESTAIRPRRPTCTPGSAR